MLLSFVWQIHQEVSETDAENPRGNWHGESLCQSAVLVPAKGLCQRKGAEVQNL